MMDQREKQHRSEEAKNLLSNELFAECMHTVRMNALVELSEVDAGDTRAIQRLQAIALCTQEVVTLLDAAIKATGELDGGIVA